MMIDGRELSEPEVRAYIRSLQEQVRQLEKEAEIHKKLYAKLQQLTIYGDCDGGTI